LPPVFFDFALYESVVSAAVTAATTPVAATTVPSAAVKATTVSVEPVEAAVEADTYPWIPAAIATPWTVCAAIVITRRVIAVVIVVAVISIRYGSVIRYRGVIRHSTTVIYDRWPLVVTRSVHATAQHEDADH
jgi:hypothetical protein